MYCVRNVTEDLYYVGGSDRKLALFENIFPIPMGVSYNAYVLMDEKTVLLDTVDYAIGRQFLENVAHVLNGKALDYLVVNHMEPDHCALMGDILKAYPEVKVVGNAKTFQMIDQFFDFDLSDHKLVVKEGDSLSTGKHTLHFVMAPMVHWPEAMVTYDSYNKVLFSADGFGSFGALSGQIFDDELNFERDWMGEARRYLTNIVGKYGAQVQALLKKAAGLEIGMICPLHGPIWRSDLGMILDKYQKWSTYEPEEPGVVIAYASMYGNTEEAAQALATGLVESGVKNVVAYDISHTDVSYLIAEMFRYSHIVLASPTYNGDIYPIMKNLLHDMKALNLQKRTVAIIENGTWAPTVGKQMRSLLEEMKAMTVLESQMTLKSAMKESQMEALEQFVQAIKASMQS